ncbi:protease inhibitor I42 family protein [Peteryoungia ipomoeae]|uniref:protease inhibitor I42 family protein n=1 Tax=Peteryoungia ipomoeae TaxID=1210932 RepID=UPI00145627B2|nr:protease inhibitor I42 family protein [Peteryoungia ipomoeae]
MEPEGNFLKTVLVTDADDETLITADLGDVLLVELEENPTTGYRWELTEKGDLPLVTSGFTPPADTAPGAGGLRRFSFDADTAVEHRLIFRLQRAWERPDQFIKSFKVIVRVRDN